MSATQRVLFPVDLSLNYQTLNATTRKLLDRPGIEIIMLHAIEEPAHPVRGTDVARAMAQMEFLARKEFGFANVSRRVERGRAGDCILDYAKNHAVDLIVIPCGGPENLRRKSLGHVTEEVLTGASCAVWMDWMMGMVESARHICCAVRLDESDETVVSEAAELAGEFETKLTLIHAVALEPPMLLWWDADAFEQELRIARLRVEEVREKFAPSARVHVEAGHLGAVVSRVLHRLGTTLLVAASQGEAVVGAAMACPVLRLATPPAGTVGLSQIHAVKALEAMRTA